MGRTGRPENLTRGRKEGDAPSRKTSEQMVKEFCLYYLTHGESIKSAGLHVGLSPTYVYEFFKKPIVQATLQKLRKQLDERLLDKTVENYICSRQFIDENLAPIISNPHPHPKRGYADQVAAARLAADIGGLLTGNKQSAPVVNAQIIQNSILGSDVYMPEIDRTRMGINDTLSGEVERRLIGSGQSEAVALGTKNASSGEGAE